MKKLVALLLAVPRLALAEAPTGPVADDAAHEVGADASSSSGPSDAAPEAAEAADPAARLSYGAEVDVASRYVWRGLAFSEHPVVQPSARLSEYHATFGVSSSAYLGTEPGIDDTVSELDLTGRYDFTLGAASISPTIGAFIYPTAPSTAELGATVSYDLQILALQTHQALDIADNAGGWYADVGAARSQPLGSRLTLDAAASLGWGSGSFARYYIEDTLVGMHWGAAQLDSALTLTATDALYFRLHGTVSRMLEEHIRELAPDDNLVSGGLALGLAH
jgi:hypothetical protein